MQKKVLGCIALVKGPWALRASISLHCQGSSSSTYIFSDLHLWAFLTLVAAAAAAGLMRTSVCCNWRHLVGRPYSRRALVWITTIIVVCKEQVNVLHEFKGNVLCSMLHESEEKVGE